MLGGCKAGRAQVGAGGRPQTLTKCAPAANGGPPSVGRDLAAPFPPSPPPSVATHLGAQVPGLWVRPQVLGSRGAGLFPWGLSSASRHLPWPVTRLFGDPVLLPDASAPGAGERAPCAGADSQLLSGLQPFCCWSSGRSECQITRGGPGGGSRAPGRAGGQSCGELALPREVPGMGGSGPRLLPVPPLPLPPGGCVLSHVGWAWAGS